MTAAGDDIWAGADQTHYAYKPRASGGEATQFAEKPPPATVAGEVWAERHGLEIVPQAEAATTPEVAK